jgi:predicted Fe-S protein YdhL (DUF1289 family)
MYQRNPTRSRDQLGLFHPRPERVSWPALPAELREQVMALLVELLKRAELTRVGEAESGVEASDE